MNISQLAERLEAKILSGSGDAIAQEVSGGYCGDLLSWVMGRANPGDAWVTIMSNPNVAAVAHLSGVACIILAEGVTPDEELLKRVMSEDMPMLSSEKSAFELCGIIHSLIRQ